MRSPLLVGLTCTLLVLRGAAAQERGTATPADPSEPTTLIDCTKWTLDGYRIGMGRDEILAVRSITLHTEGQAQAIEPGKFSGVLVLDPMSGLAKWDVLYKATGGDGLRAEMRERFGEPASEVTGELPGDPSEPMRQRRTIWWGAPCDVAIIVYENTSAGGTPAPSVHATLIRASRLSKGFLRSKTLIP